MLRSNLIFLCPVSICLASQARSDSTPLQIPLSESPISLHEDDDVSPISWKLNFSSAAPYLFSSVSSLLQQWGNTFFPNGHTLAACEIAPYTLFYHGRMDGEQPPSPEWLAFDLGMAYGIMGGSPDSHMLTYQTTRPVKALYFDGESAALMGLGQLDTQMLHLYGNVTGPSDDSGRFSGLQDEYARAHGLCSWLLGAGLRGDGWGFEGIIRMNAGFEMIWCNFTSPSLRLLTHLNVTAPQLPKRNQEDRDAEEVYLGENKMEDELSDDAQRLEASYYTLPPTPTRTDSSMDPTNPPVPPNWREWDPSREPFLNAQFWGWFSSATSHYGSSRNGPGRGEVRAKVLGCSIMSYYSSQFPGLTAWRVEEERGRLNLTANGFWKGEGAAGNRTLALQELTRRRRYHHLANVTTDEAALMRNVSERLLRGDLAESKKSCSGADWVLMVNEIKQNVGRQLEETTVALSNFPENPHNRTDIMQWLFNIRSQSHMFLVGFLEFPDTTDPPVWDVHSDLYEEVYSRCRYRYTRLMAPSNGVILSSEERDLQWVVEETFGAICSVLLTIGFGIEQAWAAHSQQLTKNTYRRGSNPEPGHLQVLADTWSNGIEELMAWLGWADEFTGCSEVCSGDERCYIPMWPLIMFTGNPRRPPGNGTYPPSYPPPYNPSNNYTHEPPSRGQRPSWDFGEADLWEPRCVKASYFMRTWHD
ncbi:hypothetical protein F5Y19DRAFT_475977 [Xylariaceae sp. FL1651]|nr:hypothetical protein F5Y19DRAFT_475977 [Xylariaceae sp. FL1651]